MPRPAAVGSGPPAALPPPSRRRRFEFVPVMLRGGWLVLAPPNPASRCWKSHFRRLSNDLIFEMAIMPNKSNYRSGNAVKDLCGQFFQTFT